MYRAHTETTLTMAGFWYTSTDEMLAAQAKGAGGAGAALDAVKAGQTVMNFGRQGVATGVNGMGGAMGVNMLGDVTTGGLGSKVFAAASPLSSLYFAYQGYQGNMSNRSGFYGLMDALSIDYASMLALRQFAGPTVTKTSGSQTPTVKTAGAFRMIRVGVGANVGASIGNAILGTPGSIIGGLAGGAASANLLVGGAVLAGATASYGAYHILKTGYRHGRNIRMGRVPHTAGDMSSFFTQNAFTMRSQAVQAMRNSHLNARSALGQEATFMHTNKNYFSTYR